MSEAAAPAASALALSGVFKGYGSTQVLENCTMSVNPGDFYVVTGAPSSGKSVLLRIVLGLEPADAGYVYLGGKDVTSEGPQERHVGYVPQSFALFPNKSVRENILYPMRLDKVGKVEMQETLDRVCELLAIEDLLDKRPDQLSGGQKQRTAIARGLAKQTDFFVLDDPLVGLDFKLRERLIDDLKATRSALGVTFLYSTSDSLESLLLASRVGVLADGGISEEGDLDEVYDSPQAASSMQALGFPSANLVDGDVRSVGSSKMCSTVLGEVEVSGDVAPGPVLVGIRSEHVQVGTAREGAISCSATLLFTEDVGGSEILYLEVDGVPMSTVLGSGSEALAAIGSGSVNIAVDPTSFVLFDPVSRTRVGQGVQHG